jgi:hypothetical protein
MYAPAVADERDRRDREAMPEADVDRAAILARRRRFILMALGGFSGVGGCRHVEPPLEPNPDALIRPPYEQARLPPPADVAIPSPPPHRISDEELRSILHDPGRDLCVDNPFDSDGPETGWDLYDEQKTEVAKVLYKRAERAKAEGELACALVLFEQAYYQVPGKHRMALVVGELAATVGDCDKARDYLEHFVTYADHGKYPEDLERVTALLDTPELRSCERPRVMPFQDAEPTPCLTVAWSDPEPEPPTPAPETPRQRRKRERAEHNAEREQQRASKMFRPK